MKNAKLILKETGLLALKSPKYWTIIYHVLKAYFGQSKQVEVFLSSYLFSRHIDDVLDLDRKIDEDPEVYVREILEAMEGRGTGPEIVKLYRFAIVHLTEMARESDNPQESFKRMIEKGMLLDYHRAKARQILTTPELNQYFKDSFEPVFDLLLMIAGSEQRAKDVPEAALASGMIYSVRDIRRDLEVGIINIPSEVLSSSSLHGSNQFDKQDVLGIHIWQTGSRARLKRGKGFCLSGERI